MSAIGKKHNIHLNQQGKSTRNSIKYQMLKSNICIGIGLAMSCPVKMRQDAIIKNI